MTIETEITLLKETNYKQKFNRGFFLTSVIILIGMLNFLPGSLFLSYNLPVLLSLLAPPFFIAVVTGFRLLRDVFSAQAATKKHRKDQFFSSFKSLIRDPGVFNDLLPRDLLQSHIESNLSQLYTAFSELLTLGVFLNNKPIYRAHYSRILELFEKNGEKTDEYALLWSHLLRSGQYSPLEEKVLFTFMLHNISVVDDKLPDMKTYLLPIITTQFERYKAQAMKVHSDFQALLAQREQQSRPVIAEARIVDMQENPRLQLFSADAQSSSFAAPAPELLEADDLARAKELSQLVRTAAV